MPDMLLMDAVPEDYPAIVELANWAYRGTGPVASWNVEAAIEGPRLTEAFLREDLAAKAAAHLLTYRDKPGGDLLGTVWLEPVGDGAVWYLGLLTVRPAEQKRQLGRSLLAAAEEFAKARGARRIRMSVLNVRDTLIAWYVRRGYGMTGERQPFPYGEERFGRPLREDLEFVVLEREI